MNELPPNYIPPTINPTSGAQTTEVREKVTRTISYKYVIAFMVILLLFVTLGFSVYYISQRTSLLSRASDPKANINNQIGGIIKLENCYLFASPLQAKAGGVEKIRITAFILDDKGKGVPGKTVTIKPDSRLVITAVDAVTDVLGKTVFDITAQAPSEYQVEALVDNLPIPQKVKLNFK